MVRQDDILTVAEAALLLQYSPGESGKQAVRRLVRDGKLSARKVGGSYWLSRAQTLAYIEAKTEVVDDVPAEVVLAGGRVFDLAKWRDLQGG